MKMKYISLINEFNKRANKYDLNASTRAVYFALLDYANSKEWPVNFKMGIRLIMERAGIGSPNTATLSINELVKYKFIKSVVANKRTYFEIIKIYETKEEKYQAICINFDTSTDTSTDTTTDTSTDTSQNLQNTEKPNNIKACSDFDDKVPSYSNKKDLRLKTKDIRLKTKEKEEKEKETDIVSAKNLIASGDKLTAFSSSDSEAFNIGSKSKSWEFYSNKVFLMAPATHCIDIGTMVDEFGDDLVLYALKRARLNKVKSLNYVKGILINWQQEGHNPLEVPKRENASPPASRNVALESLTKLIKGGDTLD